MNNIIVTDVRMTFNSLSLHKEISWSREMRVKKEEYVRKKSTKNKYNQKMESNVSLARFSRWNENGLQTLQITRIQLMPGANLTFMTGSTNYCPFTLKDHAQTDDHKRTVGEEAHAEAEASGISL